MTDNRPHTEILTVSTSKQTLHSPVGEALLQTLETLLADSEFAATFATPAVPLVPN